MDGLLILSLIIISGCLCTSCLLVVKGSHTQRVSSENQKNSILFRGAVLANPNCLVLDSLYPASPSKFCKKSVYIVRGKADEYVILNVAPVPRQSRSIPRVL